jgi:hypothetical protein
VRSARNSRQTLAVALHWQSHWWRLQLARPHPTPHTRTHLNCAKEKSEASTAARPSLPLMPQPMCAAWIMPTSLAPSPMPSVMAFALYLTSLVTCSSPEGSGTGAWVRPCQRTLPTSMC